jgi:hypothetical protein
MEPKSLEIVLEIARGAIKEKLFLGHFTLFRRLLFVKHKKGNYLVLRK